MLLDVCVCSEPRANLGSAFREAGNAKDALRAYDRGLTLDPSHKLLLEQRGILLGAPAGDPPRSSGLLSVEVASGDAGADAVAGADASKPPSRPPRPQRPRAGAGPPGRAWGAGLQPPPLALPPRPVKSPRPGRASLVECETTAGPLDVVVYDGWAPRGAGRFLDMVRAPAVVEGGRERERERIYR